MAIEALELQRDGDQPVDDLLLLAGLLKARLLLQRLGERHRIGGIGRHQLAELVDVAVAHLEHAPDVAQDGARLHRAEGDDLRHLFAAVFGLDVADHLLAPILAEVDVEIRHRDAVGIEEALEQQRKAQRVEVGDRQRIGDERAGARAAPRTDRNPLRLRPFDEVGNDQEVAREAHPLDDRELEGEAVAIGLRIVAGCRTMEGEALLQPLLRLALKLCDLGAKRCLRVVGIGGDEARQDGLADRRPERAAPGDLDRVLQRLGKIGEERAHLRLALQAVVARQPAAVLVADEPVCRDSDQGVMRVEIVDAVEERLVRRDQREAELVSELGAFGLGPVAPAFMALQLDIKPVAEHRLEPLQPFAGKPSPPCRDRRSDRPRRAAGQDDQVFGPRLQPSCQNVRALIARMGKVGHRDDIDEVGKARFARGDEDHRRRAGQLVPLSARTALAFQIGEIHFQLTPDDRLDAGLGRFLGKLERTEEVAGVGDADGGRAVGLGMLDDLIDPQRAFEKREGTVNAQMDEARFP